MTRKNPKTRGLKRELQQQREQMSSVDLIAGEINENREFWLDKVNFHLNNLLKKAKRDNKFQRHMATRCYTRNQVSKVKIKQLKKIL